MPDTDRVRSALTERYAIERELGAGGMATVYLARDLKHEREVALKVLRPDPAKRTAFSITCCRTCAARACALSSSGESSSSDAIWIYLDPPGTNNNQIVRVSFDPKTMQLAEKGDTVYSGTTLGLSVSGDGGLVVLDDGATDYSAWALPIEDLVNDRFTDDRRVIRATGSVRGSISPDGMISIVGRENSQGGTEFAVIPYGTTNETSIPGRHSSAIPLDSVTIKISDLTEKGVSLFLYNYRTPRRRGSMMEGFTSRSMIRRSRPLFIGGCPQGRSRE